MGLSEISNPLISRLGFPAGSDGTESAYNTRDSLTFNPWVGKTPWRRAWQLTPVFWPGEFPGQRSLVGYSPWRHKESDTTERLTLSPFSLMVGFTGNQSPSIGAFQKTVC